MELELEMSERDAFGNKMAVPLSESAEADVVGQSMEGWWVHMEGTAGRCAGQARAGA